MKAHRTFWGRWALILGLGLAGGPVRAEGPLRIREDSRVYLNGSATLMKWNCVSSEVEGRIDLGIPTDEACNLLEWFGSQDNLSAETRANAVRWANQKVRAAVRMPTTSLDCGNPAMKRDLLRALKAKQHPMVSFSLTRLTDVFPSTDDEAPGLVLRTEGVLELAGTRRNLVLDVLVARSEDGYFSAKAGKQLNMSDFDIDPPVALFGLVQARDSVDIVFDLHLWTDTRLAASKPRAPPTTSLR